MRITEIRDLTVGFQTSIANAVVNFASHDVSLVALVSDVIRDGRPLVGIAFNSIGRFAQSGIIRNRIAPRISAADPDSLLAADGSLDCDALYRVAMKDEKPGGHGDRAGAVAAVELAAWDLNAKFAQEPAYATIARHHGGDAASQVPVYAAGGYYYPGKDLGLLQGTTIPMAASNACAKNFRATLIKASPVRRSRSAARRRRRIWSE